MCLAAQTSASNCRTRIVSRNRNAVDPNALGNSIVLLMAASLMVEAQALPSAVSRA